MKIHTISFFSVLAILFTMAATSSCSRNDRFAGAWQAAPERLFIQGASDASATLTIDFAPTEGKAGTGVVNISAVIEVEQPVTSSGFDQAYETSVAGTASIIGRYAVDSDDDDDILVTLDPSSLQVNVDPAGVTFSQNILSRLQQPTLDSLTTSTAEAWRVRLTPAIREVFNSYRKIDDVKVHRGEILSCEIADRDVTLSRVGVPD